MIRRALPFLLLSFIPANAGTRAAYLRADCARKVLAIACKEESLAHGDHVFATADWKSLYRGIELNQRLNPPDTVTLSEDRRTVKVVFYAGASTDDIRVILEERCGNGFGHRTFDGACDYFGLVLSRKDTEV